MGSGTNMAMLFVGLKNWDERPGENSAVQAIIDRVLSLIHIFPRARTCGGSWQAPTGGPGLPSRY